VDECIFKNLKGGIGGVVGFDGSNIEAVFSKTEFNNVYN
jgi:hypothetical protein